MANPTDTTLKEQAILNRVFDPDNNALNVNATVEASGGAISDGSDSNLKATVFDLSNSNPLATQIVDSNGDAITSFGGGTQYTEGDTDTTLTGTVAIAEGPSNTATPLQVDASKHLQVDIAASSVTLTVDGSGATQPVSHAALTELAAAIDTEVQVDVVGALPAGNNNIGDVDIASSVLPTGAATSAKQDTIIGHVDGIETLLGTIDTDTGNIATNTTDLPNVIGTDGSTGPTKAVSIAGTDDSGNLQEISTDTSGRPNVNINGTVTVDGSGVTQPVSNAGLTELAAAINSSKVDVNIVSSDVATGGTSAVDDADFTDGTTPGTPAMGVYESSPSTVTDGDLGVVGITEDRRLKASAVVTGTVAVTQSGTWDEVGINDSGNSITVDATNLDVRDLSAASDSVTIHGDVGAISQLDLTNSNPVTVAIVDSSGDQISSFGGGTQYTEDAAAAANPVGTAINLVRDDNLSGSLTNTDGDNVAARGNNKGEQYVKATDSDALLTTIDADTGNIVTSVQVMDDWDESDRAKVNIVVGQAGVSAGAGSVAANTPRITLASDDPAVALLGTIDTDTGNVATAVQIMDDWDESDRAKVNPIVGQAGVQGGSGSVSATTQRVVLATDVALPAGTNAIGKLAANSGVDIGDVDITSIAAGDNNIGNVDVVTLPALTAGTNAIGKLLPPDIDVTAHTNYARKYYTSAGAATDGIIWSPAAGKRWHVVALYIQVSAAATVTLEDDKAGGDDPVWKSELAANSGAFMVFPEKYPMASGEDAADLLITTSAGNVYVTAVGYEI